MEYYQKEYGKDLRKIIATKIASYKNFKDFMLKVGERESVCLLAS